MIRTVDVIEARIALLQARKRDNNRIIRKLEREKRRLNQQI